MLFLSYYMKSLKPSMREKKRYLLIEGENLKENIKNSVMDFIGFLGFAKSGLKFIKIEKNKVIISVNRETLNHVRASFAVWPAEIKVIKVSGTLKGLKR